MTNEYKISFEGIFSKLASIGFSFGDKEIKKESQRFDYRKGFATFPEIEKFTIKAEKWIVKIKNLKIQEKAIMIKFIGVIMME